ncbi:hypothetical protein [Ruicaihuangia caeni]|uniref:hypothetical protein n=1 Tax=Ruicaihuangia caeni TaxID=3042517 RepID=UPI00338E9DEF
MSAPAGTVHAGAPRAEVNEPATTARSGRYIDAWVDVVPPASASGTLKQAYDWQAAKLGEPTEYTQLGSLIPELVLERLQLYKVVDAARGELDELEWRVIAFVTSRLNETPHCSSGLEVKLGELGLGHEARERLVAQHADPDTGDARLDALIAYTSKLTLAPGSIRERDIERLRTAGLSDRDIVAANNLSAYFSYTNRVATGLGLRTVIPTAHAHDAVPE